MRDQLDKQKKDDEGKYNKIVKEINANFSGTFSTLILGSTDGEFAQVLTDVRAGLHHRPHHDIRFENISDRIAIGDKLLERIRSEQIKR